MKKIPVDIYHATVLAFDDYNDLKRYCKKSGGGIMEDSESFCDINQITSSSDGLTGYIAYEDNSVDMFIAVDRPGFIKEDSVDMVDLLDAIMHESIHSSYHILSGKGVEIDVHNHESLTYLSTYLFRQFLDKFKILEKA